MAENDIPLFVRILGPVNDETMGELQAQLLQYDFESMCPGDQIIIQLDDHFKAYVTKALRNWWFRVDDRRRNGQYESYTDHRRAGGDEIETPDQL